jgi:hypothetical protein
MERIAQKSFYYYFSFPKLFSQAPKSAFGVVGGHSEFNLPLEALNKAF